MCHFKALRIEPNIQSLCMMRNNKMIQLYIEMKISIHDKCKHTSKNKLFLYLFVCKFLLLYYCNLNVEFVI